jgi:hypothetical protein
MRRPATDGSRPRRVGVMNANAKLDDVLYILSGDDDEEEEEEADG